MVVIVVRWGAKPNIDMTESIYIAVTGIKVNVVQRGQKSLPRTLRWDAELVRQPQRSNRG